MGTDTGWLRLASIFAVASFVETVSFGHFLTFLPLLVRSLGVTDTDLAVTVGVLSVAAFIAGLPLVPFWGAWADRYSRKLVIVRSAAVETVLFLLLSRVDQVAQLFLLVPMAGLVLGNTGVMLSEVSDRAPRERLAFAISIVGMASPLGFAIGPAVGGVIADHSSVQTLFLIDGVLSALVVVMLATLYHERHRVPSGVSVLGLVRASLLAIVRTPLARGVFVAYSLVLLGQRLIAPYVPIYVQQLAGPAQLATVVGLVAGVYGLASAIGSPLAGSVADRAGYRRVFTVGVITAGTCLMLAAVAPSLLAFTLIYALFGMGFATCSAMLFTMLAAGLPTTIRSSVLNLALAPLYLSGVVGSLISAAVLRVNGGDLAPLWVAGGIVALLALVPVSRLRLQAATAPATMA
ncbi:MAG: MFS transporter [Candidatus Limnocylindrales bacterium]